MNCPGQLKINVICYLFLIITLSLMHFILRIYHINVNTVVAGSSNGEVIRA